MKRITKEDFTMMPWKNGGGITSEIFRLSDHQETDFNLRLSIASVAQDGPFSTFPGIERILLILNGAGCTLERENGGIRLTPESAPLVFSGEETILCRLIDGPFQDFNIMIKRSWGKATVLAKPQGILNCQSDYLLIFEKASESLVILETGELYRIQEPVIAVEIKRVLA